MSKVFNIVVNKASEPEQNSFTFVSINKTTAEQLPNNLKEIFLSLNIRAYNAIKTFFEQQSTTMIIDNQPRLSCYLDNFYVDVWYTFDVEKQNVKIFCPIPNLEQTNVSLQKYILDNEGFVTAVSGTSWEE